MNANSPVMVEKLKALNGEILRIDKAGAEPEQSGDIFMQTVHSDEDVFEVIRVWSEDPGRSNLIKSKRGTVFVAVKGNWFVKLGDRRRTNGPTVEIPGCVPFTLVSNEVGSVGLLIVS